VCFCASVALLKTVHAGRGARHCDGQVKQTGLHAIYAHLQCKRKEKVGAGTQNVIFENVVKKAEPGGTGLVDGVVLFGSTESGGLDLASPIRAAG
jgi:hypothetical protein